MENDVRERLYEERRQLKDRIDNLSHFISFGSYGLLPERDRLDLWEQLSYMRRYCTVLDCRLKREVG